MHLVDTNVWLELLLEQERAADVRRFLTEYEPGRLHITEFSFYSISIVMVRLNSIDLLRRFIYDLFSDRGVNLIRISPQEMETVLTAADRFGLDFDDAYQYAAAEIYSLQIVSFDDDFDRTERGRKSPLEVIP